MPRHDHNLTRSLLSKAPILLLDGKHLTNAAMSVRRSFLFSWRSSSQQLVVESSPRCVTSCWSTERYQNQRRWTRFLCSADGSRVSGQHHWATRGLQCPRAAPGSLRAAPLGYTRASVSQGSTGESQGSTTGLREGCSVPGQHHGICLSRL